MGVRERERKFIDAAAETAWALTVIRDEIAAQQLLLTVAARTDHIPSEWENACRDLSQCTSLQFPAARRRHFPSSFIFAKYKIEE